MRTSDFSLSYATQILTRFFIYAANRHEQLAAYSFYFVFHLTTYLTIDNTEAHENNGYKTSKEDLLRSGNGYKKPFAAESIILFWGITSQEHIPQPTSANTL